jgi:hypothetical protein
MASNDRPRSWDSLYEALEAAIKWAQEIAASYPDYFASHNIQQSLDANRRLYDILPALQTHPVLGIPYIAPSEFRWTPDEHYRITLNTIIDKNRYCITLRRQGKDQAQAFVAADQIIPTLLDYLSRANG